MSIFTNDSIKRMQEQEQIQEQKQEQKQIPRLELLPLLVTW